ncbi:hypothetical protein [Methylobacterium sp. 17Sr1-1]|uniref:hypothetical protein n=1 Tax=Methylobacterium sp. 17Sr1-1 TaxID=2202826 RepID=UPI001951BCB2|nr:hypothetical protein [Methylobacterium sp. 17Sr1-1]
MSNGSDLTPPLQGGGSGGLSTLQPMQPPSTQATGILAPVVLEIDDETITVFVPVAEKHSLRQRFRALARREKRRAADAGNAAQTAQQIGIGIGGTLGTGGLIALATATGPLTAAGILATVAGVIIAAVGLVASHEMNSRKLAHQEWAEEYQEKVEDLR